MEALVAHARQRVAQGQQPPNNQGACTMLGGLVSANLSATCCFSVNVAAQRTLHSYGLAYACASNWECEKDGVTPTAAFERRAVDHLCSEPHCSEYVVSAMKTNWMTQKGSDAFSRLCAVKGDKSTQVTTISEEGAEATISALRGQAGVLSANSRRSDVNTTTNGTKGPAPGSDEWDKCQEDNCKTDKARDEFCKKDGSKDDECFDVCCKQSALVCFPGNAIVHSRGRGDVPISTLRMSEDVLVEGADGQFVFAPVLGFIHSKPEVIADYLNIVHETGQFRASHNHLVFVTDDKGNRIDKIAGHIKVGDKVFTVDGVSVVTNIYQSSAGKGMFAPLTPTGTILVDRVVASNYASPSRDVKLPHSVAHFALFPVRLYHHLGLSHVGSAICYLLPWSSLCTDHEYHPYVQVLYKTLQAHRWLSHA